MSRALVADSLSATKDLRLRFVQIVRRG